MRSDGVQMALLANRFHGIARAMTNTLLRTGRSGVINTARDFSCCILTADDKLIGLAEAVPTHVMSGPDRMAQVMREFHPELKRGDAFLHNSPYHGNTHAADHTLLVPVIDDEGRHRFTVLAKAHQADCGNSAPTTYMAAAKDVYEEGALIFPAVRVQEDYEHVMDVIRMCRLRIRAPEQWWGDYLATLGAVRVGERQLIQLGEEVGWDELERYAEDWFDHSEQLMVDRLSGLQSGVATVETANDPFPGVPDGIPVKATIEVDAEQALIHVDLRDNVDCQPCGLNLSEACSQTAAMVGVFAGLGGGVPHNSGSFRRIRVQLREGCVVGVPAFPFSCSIATTNLADRVMNAVQRAMAEIGEGMGLAESGLVMPPAWGVISGPDPDSPGQTFINQVLLHGVTGGPGTPFADGWLTFGHSGNGGLMFRDSVEVDEMQFPIVVREQRILSDSEGAGRFRSAPTARVEFGPLDQPLDVRYVSDGTINVAKGVRGGSAGVKADQFRRDREGNLHQAPAVGGVQLDAGETVVSIASSGGGYGPPMTRDPELVRHDVLEGWITEQRAGEIYGVVLDPDGKVDVAATQDLRSRAATDSQEPG